MSPKTRWRRPALCGGLVAAALLACAGHLEAQAPALVKDIAAGAADSTPVHLINVNGTLFFQACTSASGCELWKSDGTTAGTVLVKDIAAGAASSSPDWLTDVNGTVFFAATDPTNGLELWKSDGTLEGTVLVKDIASGAASASPAIFAAIGSTLYFQACTSAAGCELWKSNGTSGGTVLVSDIAPGIESSSPYALTNVNGTLFFGAFTAAAGFELWKSDGTTGGTVFVKDVQPGVTGSFPSSFTAVGGTLYFAAHDGTHGVELWKSNGTTDGTVLVKDINPTGSASPNYFVNLNGTLLFRACDSTSGCELWKSDGTAAGTALVKDINAGSTGSNPYQLAVINGSVAFPADNGTSGFELWKSDGTTAGTVLLKDIAPGAASSSPSNFTRAGNTFFFAADNGTTGVELWRSDGTPTGTVLSANINAGTASSNPSGLTVVGSLVLFAATDGISGRELWSVGGLPTGPWLNSIPTLVVGETNVLTGLNFTAGTVIKLFVATSTGPLSYGPYNPTAWSPTSLTWSIPPTVPLGNGFGAIYVVNTDENYVESNVVGSLLFGDAKDNIPTILQVDSVGLGPADLSIAVAHIDTVVAKGGTVTITGTGFNLTSPPWKPDVTGPAVNLYTANGNVGPLWPLPGATSTQIQVQVPVGTVTGPGNFQVVNSPFSGNVQSNSVAAVVTTTPTISGVTVNGSTVTVNGAGFSVLSVINLFNLQGGNAVNLGGLLTGTTGKIPLTFVNENQFTFTVPASAVAGPAFVEVLNPPFIPFSSSGSDPDGAFNIPAGALLTMSTAALGSDRSLAGDSGTGSVRGDESGDEQRGLVRWTRLVDAAADGPTLWKTGGKAWAAGASSTEALAEGDGGVRWVVPAGTGDVVIGLSHGDTDASVADIDYGLRLQAATHELVVYEGGERVGAVGTYAEGDELGISIRAGVVEYRHNGAVVWTSTATPQHPLLVDVSMGTAGARIDETWLTGTRGTNVEWFTPRGVEVSGTRVTAAVPTNLASSRTIDGGVVTAELRGTAAIGFGQADCDYCVVQSGPEVQVRHAGELRGSWPASADGRSGVELDAVAGVVRYWSGKNLVFEAPLMTTEPLTVTGWVGSPDAALINAVVVRSDRRP